MNTIIVLGGGFFPDGSLTNLSKQRLDKAKDIFENGDIKHITVLGQRKSTYFNNAIQYDKAGAEKRAEYLVDIGIPDDKIYKIIGGRDTIGEAIACRDNLPSKNIDSFILVTSDIHMPRSLWLFKTILGNNYKITPCPVSCGGILLKEEEDAYLEATKNYFSKYEGLLDEDVADWHEKHSELYVSFKGIHDKFHPAGKESEAYCAVSKSKTKEK